MTLICDHVFFGLATWKSKIYSVFFNLKLQTSMWVCLRMRHPQFQNVLPFKLRCQYLWVYAISGKPICGEIVLGMEPRNVQGSAWKHGLNMAEQTSILRGTFPHRANKMSRATKYWSELHRDAKSAVMYDWTVGFATWMFWLQKLLLPAFRRFLGGTSQTESVASNAETTAFFGCWYPFCSTWTPIPTHTPSASGSFTVGLAIGSWLSVYTCNCACATLACICVNNFNHLLVNQEVRSAIHTLQQLSYRFPIFETSTTALLRYYW